MSLQSSASNKYNATRNMRNAFLKTYACAIFLLATPLFAATNPYDIPEALDKELQIVLHAAFNLNFDEARSHLSDIKKYAAAHPMVALANVVVSWWDISVKVLEVDSQASEEFLNASEECMDLAERAIARGDKKGEGNLALGTTLGLLSRWSAANRAWLPAYMRGSRSTRYADRVLQINPKASDAYMTLGTFNYAREILRDRVSTMDPKPKEKTTSQGLRQLRLASEHGHYFRCASQLLLAGILTNEKPEAAIPLLEQLRMEMPTSGFVHMVLITALYNTGRAEELTKETTTYMELVSTGTYSAWFWPQAYFSQGLVAFREHRWKDAAEEFENAIDHGDETNPYFTWAHLYQGYACDAQGERRKAKKMYEKVLKLKRRFASHDHANNHMSTPFQPTDPELKKLEL